MDNLKIFQNDEFGTIRSIRFDNDVWFVGTDITEKLEYQNGSRDIKRHVDEEDWRIIPFFDGKQSRATLVINESGLYALIMGSTLPNAKKFKHWVTAEVLPEIRKTGGYNIPKTYAEALRALADKQDANERLERENARMLPKAEFYDAVMTSKDTMSIRDAAKVLNMGMGQNRLYAFLRQQKILMADNRPYQRYIDAGYFKLVEQEYEQDGRTKIHYKPVVYQKGLDFIRRRIKQEEEQYG